MEQKTKNKISLKAMLIVALLIVAFILPNMSSILLVNAETYYTVNFNLKGGTLVSGEKNQYIKSGSSAIPPIVSLDGYMFLGWKDSINRSIDVTNYLILQDEIFIAQWQEIKSEYTITFNLNGGEFVSGALVQTVASGGKIIFPLVKRSGYTLLCWENSIYIDPNNVTNDGVYKAIWTQVQESYTVTFNTNGGKKIGGGELVQTVAYNGSFTYPIVERDGYIFKYWDRENGSVVCDITINAVWEAKPRYTVTFDLNGGKLVSGALVQSIVSGGSAELPIIERDGYIFDGWDKSLDNILSDCTITAQWQVGTQKEYYNIFLNDYDGTQISVNTVEKGTSYILNYTGTAKQGFVFDSWRDQHLNVYANGSSVKVLEELIFTAILKEVDTSIKYTVTFALAKGERIGGGELRQEITAFESAIPPIVTRENYTFNGWNGDYTNVTSNLVLTAQWLENTRYTVTFNPNGGTVKSGYTLQGVYTGGSAVAPIVERNGYIFAGWDKSLDNITSDCTITAQWQEATIDNSCIVIFILNGAKRTGGGEIEQIIEIGGSVIPPIVELKGYIFDGWNSSLDNITSNKSIMPKWVKEEGPTFLEKLFPKTTKAINDIKATFNKWFNTPIDLNPFNWNKDTNPFSYIIFGLIILVALVVIGFIIKIFK